MPIINIYMNAFTCRLWQSHRRMPQEENYKSCYTLTMTLSIGIVLMFWSHLTPLLVPLLYFPAGLQHLLTSEFCLES